MGVSYLELKMQVGSLLLVAVYCTALLCSVGRGQMITQPPVSTTAALGTNATFTCRGDAQVFWEISGTLAITEMLVSLFAQEQIYVPLPTQSYSELIMTATNENNFTRAIKCQVASSSIDTPVESDIVRLLVYAEPFPPTNLRIAVDGLSLVTTWTGPFSIEGEEISYDVSVVNMATGATEEITVETPRYVLTDPIGTRDCAEYEISVVSRNGYSTSSTGVRGIRNIPTEPLQLTTSDVSIDVSLDNGVRATITFSSSDPCPTYPVRSYTFNITERDSNNLITSITHTDNVPLVVDDSLGLGPNQFYQLVIESQNDVGSTPSEKILFYTTGLQSSTAVMEPDGSITFTCTFAPGASSTGCQVTIFTMDGVQELVSRNITRSNGANQVTENIVISGVSMDSRLLVRTAELLSDGTVGSALFNGMVTVFVSTTEPPNTPHSTLTTWTVLGTSNPTPFGNTFYFIIGAVIGSIVLLLLLIILTVCVIFSLRRTLKRNTHFLSMRDESPSCEGITNRLPVNSETDIQATRNPVYAGIVVHSASERASVQPMSNGRYVTVVYTAQGRSGIDTVNSVNETKDDPPPLKRGGDGQEQQSNN